MNTQGACDRRVRRRLGRLRPHPRPDNTLPLHVEVLYNEYNFQAAFAVASMLTGLAIVTLVLKTIAERRVQQR